MVGSFCYHFALILYFDGSYTNPPETSTTLNPSVPFFPYSDTYNKNLRSIASCGAAVYHQINDDYDDDSLSLLALGGKTYPPYSPNYDSTMTSANIEYEGLLLGLRWIWNMLVNNENSNDQILHFFPQNDYNIIIRGDCKTVISQMQGKSKPRKLSTEYDNAISLIHQIEKKLIDIDDKTRKNGSGCDGLNNNKIVSFELIGREHNKVTDAISKMASSLIRRKAITKVLKSITKMDEIEHDEARYKLESTNENRKRHMKKKKKKKGMFPLNASYFFDILDLIMSNDVGSALTHVDRIVFLQELAQKAQKSNDADALAAIGGAIRVEATRMNKKSIFFNEILDLNDPIKSSNDYDSLDVTLNWKEQVQIMNTEGILLEVKALRLFGFENDASTLEKRYQCLNELGEGIAYKDIHMPLRKSQYSFMDSYSSNLDTNISQFLRSWETLAYNNEESIFNSQDIWLDGIGYNVKILQTK